VIEKDQAIVSKILKLVNSAFFGLSSRVSNIPHAVMLLGFNAIRNAVVSVSVINAFDKNSFPAEFEITEFWKHSVSVAVISRVLAEKSRLHSPDECFIAGLLHDVGKLVLCQYLPDLFAQVLQVKYKANHLDFYEAENSSIPTNHAQIGSFLGKKWKLPSGLVDTIRMHHKIKENAPDLNLLYIVQTANVITNSPSVDAGIDLQWSKLHPNAAEALAKPLADIKHWYPPINIEIESACKFFLQEL
jgi:HD-like signal output (HDOD) protein